MSISSLINNLCSLSKTIKSLTKIFYITNYINENIKVIMFYFPVKAYQENIIELVKNFKKKNYLIILAYNFSSAGEIKKSQNSYFVDLGYLKFIPFKNIFLKNINFFLSSYLSYIYPPNSKNVYISHDIYDAPMINKKMEKKMFLRINRLDYIFVASEVSKKYFENKLIKFNNNIKPEIINTGYLKLDHVYKKLNSQKKTDNKSVLIAPAYSLNYKEFNMTKSLNKLIDFLINKLNQKVIYRPHPLDLTKKGDKILVTNIVNRFKNNKNFKTDLSISYLNSYKNAKLLITDITSTAYTFAFSTENPVIFYSPKEKIIKKDSYFNISYIKDRNKIGIISRNFYEIKNAINKIETNKKIYRNKILKLRKQKIKFFNMAKNITTKKLTNLIYKNDN